MSPDPDLWRITLDTNPDDCNLGCIMCEEHSPHRPGSPNGPRRRMPFILVEKAVRSALPLGLREVIPSTMGEPLLYPDMERLVALVRELGLKLNVTTNGTFPRLGARAWGELLAPVSTDVKVSWNGATPATYESIMTGARFSSALERLGVFAAARDDVAAQRGWRCRLTLQLTFLEMNLGELPDVVDLAARVGVDRVKGHHVWTHWPILERQSLRRSEDSVRRWNAVVERCRSVADERGILLDGFELLRPNAATHLDPEAACPFLGREAWISAVGRFDPCCAPDALRQTLGEFGSLADRDLGEIWHSSDYRLLVSSYRERPLCRSCNMRRRAA